MPRVHTSALDTSALRRAVSRFLRDEDGASLVEYVLLIALIAVVCVGAVTLLGTNTNAKLGTASDALK
jgi:pilus assembly protein Flp/PilA